MFMKNFLIVASVLYGFTGVAEAKLPVSPKALMCARGKFGPTCKVLAACSQMSLSQFCNTYNHPCCSSSSADGAQGAGAGGS